MSDGFELEGEELDVLLDEIKNKIDEYVYEGGSLCDVIKHLITASYNQSTRLRDAGDDIASNIWESIARDLEDMHENIYLRVYG